MILGETINIGEFKRELSVLLRLWTYVFYLWHEAKQNHLEGLPEGTEIRYLVADLVKFVVRIGQRVDSNPENGRGYDVVGVPGENFPHFQRHCLLVLFQEMRHQFFSAVRHLCEHDSYLAAGERGAEVSAHLSPF